jgi:hypothetical protein
MNLHKWSQMFKLLPLPSLVPCRIIPTGVNLNESPMEQAAGINPLLLFIADVGFGLQHCRDGTCAKSSYIGRGDILLLADAMRPRTGRLILELWDRRHRP